MFDSKNEDYAIDLLARMKRDNAIIVSAALPARFRLSKDKKKLTIIHSEKLNTTPAVTIDLAGNRSGEMLLPCIYVNIDGFVAKERQADNYALYPLDRKIQRAVGLLHELAHAAGVIQFDGQVSENGNYDESAANTDCVRRNCILCSTFEVCPNGSELQHRRGLRAYLDFSLTDSFSGIGFGSPVTRSELPVVIHRDYSILTHFAFDN
jgi:hypothetical protein